MSHRLTVNLTDQNHEALETLAEMLGMSLTDVTNRSIGLYLFLEQEKIAGKRIATIDTDGHVERLHFL